MNNWEKVPLISLSDITMGQSPDSDYYNSIGNGFKFLQGCAEFGPKYPNSEIYCSQPKKIAEKNSILFSVRAPVGKINIADINYCIGRGLASILPRNIDSVYLYQYLLWYEKFLQILSQGSTFSSINSNDLKNLIVLKPIKKEEQSSIARILSTVDKAIEQTEKLIAKYKRIKTGLMQDLLTKGIDENGNIRSEKTHKFKDSPLGRIPVEWEIVNLGNNKYFELATGGTPSTTIKEYWIDGIIPWLSSGEVHQKVIKTTAVKITQLGLENSNARYYPIGSILMALAGQGRTRGTVAISEIATTSNQSVAAIIPNNELFLSYFIFHQLDSRYEELRSISSGSGRAGLSLRILKNINVLFTSPNEQLKIVNKLNQIDEFLFLSYTNLEKLTKLKFGLMQDLLTGKVRVPEELIEEINNLRNEE